MIKLKKIFNIFIVLILLFTASSCSFSKPILDGKSYDTIENLFEDFKCVESANKSEIYIADELAFYIKIEDKTFVFYTYFSKNKNRIDENNLLAIVVSENKKGRYELLTPEFIGGLWCELPLSNDYDGNDYHCYYFMDCKLNGEKKSIGFAYKEIDDTYNLYYDGIKMEEEIFFNPFTNKEFILCYAVSDVTYNVIKNIFVNLEDRHSLEVR